MPTEDFTTYTEVDPNSHITVTASKCETLNIARNEDAYVYKDRGAGHFSDFEFLFTVRTKTGGHASSIVYVAVVGNSVDDWNGLTAGIGVKIQGDPNPPYTICLLGRNTTETGYGCPDNTVRYCTLNRTGATVKLYIYSDAARTNLLTTLQITLNSADNVSYRYVYGMQSGNDGYSYAFTGVYIQDLDLQDVGIGFDAVGSGNNGSGATSITWTHVVGSGSDRLMLIGVSIRTTTVSVSSITVGSQNATFIRADNNGTNIRAELWYLLNPTAGSQTVTVNLSGTSKAAGGSCTYTGVNQTSPFDTNNANTGTSTTPNCSITLAGTNEWTFHNIAWQGIATVSSHDSGQTDRWNQATTGGAAATKNTSHGDDKKEPTSGSKSYQVTVSASSIWVFQVVAFKPAEAVTYINVPDSGSGSDAIAIQTQIFITQSSVGSEAVGIESQLAVSDAGLGTDAIVAAQPKDISDVGQGSEAISIEGQIPIQDSGAGADQINIQSQVPIQETGSSSDAVSVDTGVTQVNVPDNGSGSEAISIEATIPVSETASGVDQIGIEARVLITEAGQGSDITEVKAEIAATETSQSVDTVDVKAETEISDASVGTEQVAIQSFIIISETGQGVDGVQLKIELLIPETGAGSDTIFVDTGFTYKEVLDDALGADIIQISATISVTDVGSGQDIIKAACLIEAPLIIVTKDGKILLRISIPTKAQPDYMSLS